MEEDSEMSKYFQKKPCSLLGDTPEPGYASFTKQVARNVGATSTPMIPRGHSRKNHEKCIGKSTPKTSVRRTEFGVNVTNLENAGGNSDHANKRRKLRFAEDNPETRVIGQNVSSEVAPAMPKKMLQVGAPTLPKSILRKSPTTPERQKRGDFNIASSSFSRRLQSQTSSISGLKSQKNKVMFPSPDITTLPPPPCNMAPPPLKPRSWSKQIALSSPFPHPFTEEIIIEPSTGQGNPGSKCVKLKDDFSTREFVDLLLDANTLSWDITPDPVTQVRRVVFQQKIE